MPSDRIGDQSFDLDRVIGFLRNSTPMKITTRPLIMSALVLGCIAFFPNAQAVSPPPDGGYSGGNTAEGQNDLLSLTSGGFNTAIGAGTLLANTADENTAVGAGALLSNTTGFKNTANGTFALVFNTTGSGNTAIGDSALFDNSTGNSNVAIGFQA